MKTEYLFFPKIFSDCNSLRHVFISPSPIEYCFKKEISRSIVPLDASTLSYFPFLGIFQNHKLTSSLCGSGTARQGRVTRLTNSNSSFLIAIKIATFLKKNYFYFFIVHFFLISQKKLDKIPKTDYEYDSENSCKFYFHCQN